MLVKPYAMSDCGLLRHLDRDLLPRDGRGPAALALGAATASSRRTPPPPRDGVRGAHVADDRPRTAPRGEARRVIAARSSRRNRSTLSTVPLAGRP
jgi:hypothetical protein